MSPARVLQACCVLLLTSTMLRAQEIPTAENLKSFAEARNNTYAQQLESYLRTWLVDQYAERAGFAWHRDYSSVDAFLRSVEPQRARWRNVLKPPSFVKTG